MAQAQKRNIVTFGSDRVGQNSSYHRARWTPPKTEKRHAPYPGCIVLVNPGNKLGTYHRLQG